ncbi:MAG: PaaI family thioesterase [Planctomycetota bacterium]
MTTEPHQTLLEETRAQAHGRCAVCGRVAGHPPRLRFAVGHDGSVQAFFQPDPAHEGYDGLLHGGVIATLLDAAMTNCLFAHGRRGLTAELCVRFRHPVLTAAPVRLRAWVERASPPLFVLRAQIEQEGRLRATAVGKFMDKARAVVAAPTKPGPGSAT